MRTPSGMGGHELAGLTAGLALNSPPPQTGPPAAQRPPPIPLPVPPPPSPPVPWSAPLRTCWPLLPLLLPLLALVQLLESLCRLLQPSHEPLNVVQGTVEDLLGSEGGGVQPQAPPALQGQPGPPSLSLGAGWGLEGPSHGARRWGRPPCPKTHRFLFYLLGQQGTRLLVLRLPTAEA